MDLECSDIIAWLPHGLSFKILDYKRFAEETIPKYFRHTKLTSFQRQLNLYGFRRISKGQDNGAYFHANFQRGRPDLVAEIRRLPGKPILTGFSRIEDNKDDSENDLGDVSAGTNKRAFPLNDMNDSSDNYFDQCNQFKHQDINSSYIVSDEQKSASTNALHTSPLDCNNPLVPANKMSKVSLTGMNTMMGMNMRIRWIPVFENSTTPMNDLNDVCNNPIDMNMMMMMSSMMGIMPNGLPNGLPHGLQHGFVSDQTMGTEDIKIQPPESGLAGPIHSTTHAGSATSSTTTTAEGSEDGSSLNFIAKPNNASIPDDSNFLHDFDELCGDLDFDSLLDSDTVDCLQDLLSC